MGEADSAWFMSRVTKRLYTGSDSIKKGGIYHYVSDTDGYQVFRRGRPGFVVRD